MTSLFRAEKVNSTFMKFIERYDSICVNIDDEKFINKSTEVFEKITPKGGDVTTFLKEHEGNTNMFIKTGKIECIDNIELSEEEIIKYYNNLTVPKGKQLNMILDIIVSEYTFNKNKGLTYKIKNIENVFVDRVSSENEEPIYSY